MRHQCRHLQLCPEAAQGHVPFSVMFFPDLVLGCGVEWAGAKGWGIVAAGGCAAAWDLDCLSQDLSAPEPAPSCSVGRAKQSIAAGERIAAYSSPGAIPPRRAFLWHHPVCALSLHTKSTTDRPTAAMCMQTVGSEVRPGPRTRPSWLSPCN